jgi:hypothetical protein
MKKGFEGGSDKMALTRAEGETINGVEVVGRENIERVKEMNARGVQVMFAPNHVQPNSKIRQNLAMAEDYPRFRGVLKKLGLSTAVVFRGDTDMEIGKSRVRRLIYDMHRKIAAWIGRVYSGGGIPLAINKKEPEMAAMRNLPALRKIGEVMKKGNLTMFPYGNWFEARKQEFNDLDGREDFVSMKDYEQWRESLKPGFIQLARKNKAPVVPVYFDNTGGKWVMQFGEPMEVPELPGGYSRAEQKKEDLAVARKYLEQMQVMRGRSGVSE